MLHKTQEEVKSLADSQNIIICPDGSWENTGDFTSFYCYWCLDKFSTHDEREVHKLKCKNKEMNYSAQMDPNWGNNKVISQ